MSKPTASPLSTWLRAQMKERGPNQTALTARAGIAAGTVNDILRKGHVPKIETLFRLADALETSHIDIMLVTGHLRRGDELPGAPTAPHDHEAESNIEKQRSPQEAESIGLDALALQRG